jgi:negative regulator of flagellin synthesis FlgM
MTHKIDGTTPRSPVSGPSPLPARQESAPSPAPSTDTVALTDTARLMQRVENMLANVPPTDRARVDAVRQALANGAYEIDPERVAARIVRLERELSGRR